MIVQSFEITVKIIKMAHILFMNLGTVQVSCDQSKGGGVGPNYHKVIKLGAKG